MTSLLQGKAVKIKSNDFVASDLFAEISYMSDKENKLLLKIIPELSIKNVSYSYAVVSPRLVKDKVNDLLNRGVLGSSIVWIPDTRFNPLNPLDISWWRGGGAAISDIELISPNTGLKLPRIPGTGAGP